GPAAVAGAAPPAEAAEKETAQAAASAGLRRFPATAGGAGRPYRRRGLTPGRRPPAGQTDCRPANPPLAEPRDAAAAVHPDGNLPTAAVPTRRATVSLSRTRTS